MPLTQARLKEALDYNPCTGIFRWKIKAAYNVNVGDEAGWRDKGYRVIKIDRRSYGAHRLAWLYIYGKIPAGLLDHENRSRGDNRIVNLREADKSGNGANQLGWRNGLKGASWHKGRNKWRATITHRGRCLHLGLFKTEQEAHAAYWSRAQELHGEFACAA